MEKLFFQSSMPRAGSTLLQNIFAQNPDIYATPTSGVLELVYAARANYTESPEFKAQDGELMKEGFRNFCRKGVEGFYEGITDKKYVVDKSRGWGIHYDMLNFFYPQPKVICMGAYWAGRHYLNLMDGCEPEQYIRRPNTCTKRYYSKAVECNWNGNTDRFFFYDGPAFVGDESKFEVVARYKNGDAAAIIQNKIGLIGPHLEAEEYWYDDHC